MSFAILSSDASRRIDGTVQRHLLSFVDTVPLKHADVVLVPVSYLPEYRFNPELNVLDKPWVLLDFLEFGWDAGDKNNLLGTGALAQYGHLNSEEWAKLDNWVRDHPPVLEFKRELFARDANDRRKPISFPCPHAAGRIESKAEFDARPLEVFYCWGLSNPNRPQLHGDIFRHSHEKGIFVADHWDDETHFERRTWATIHVPWYRRKAIGEVMRWNGMAKLSVSLWGAGKTCFRTTMESPVSSILALPEDDLVWPFAWEHGVNCIRLKPDALFESLEEATRRDDLYAIYLEGQKTVARYRSRAFVDQYVLPLLGTIS